MKKCIVCNKDLRGNQQKFCSGACKQKNHWNMIKIQPNTYHNQTIRALTRKLKFVEMLGGCCNKCGYNKNLAALEFNHLDPSNKSFSLDCRKLSNTNEKDLLEELKKCELLCANCHREHHYLEMDTIYVKNMLVQYPEKK